MEEWMNQWLRRDEQNAAFFNNPSSIALLGSVIRQHLRYWYQATFLFNVT